VFEYGYFGAGNYEDYLQTMKVCNPGSSAVKVTEYGRTNPDRPDLYTSQTVYEDVGTNGRTTTYAYSFYDTDSNGIKEVSVTYPIVSAAKNGPGTAATAKRFYDTNGRVRWTLDGEGYVNYYGYDDYNSNGLAGAYATGRRTFSVTDADTTTLTTVIDGDWDGTEYGYGSDDAVPFARSGGGTALDLGTNGLQVHDFLGRTRKVTNADGLVTWFVYKDGETRVYPAWDAAGGDCDLPWRVNKMDEEGRAEESITLDTSGGVNTNGSGEPDGSETLSQGDYVSWTVNEYCSAGRLTGTKRYHDIPSSGNGTRYSNYYQTSRAYDEMGRLEYVFEDVADESPEDREQVTQNVYDVMGRVIETKMGVSDKNHDAVTSNGVPTMVTTSETFYDDDTDATPEQGKGDGNVSWTLRYYGTGGGDHNDTEYRYDWRNRRCLTLPPDKPYTLVGYDNLGRVTASATYNSTSGLDAGDDPAATEAANRLSLSKTHYDEMGRVYKSERFMDPSDSTPADALTNNTYRDRRGLVVATDSANGGVTETVYDGAGRRTQGRRATELESTKYTSGAFNYLDDNENIVQVSDYTLDESSRVTQTVHKELNHDDTNGMDLDGTDFIRTYAYNWYDGIGRLSDTANYGCNDSSSPRVWKDTAPPSYGSSAPACSDDILVTSHSYNSAGRRYQVTGPDGVVARTDYDDLGRTVAKTEDYGTGGALNRKTEYQYNAQGSLVRIIHDPDADNTHASGTWTMAGSDTDQATEYAYTDDTSARWVKEIRYPTGDGTVGSAAADKIVFTYNVDGTVATRTDQNGSVLTWAYDGVRRKENVKVTTVGTDVSTNALAVTWTYTDRGSVEYVTTHSDTTPDTSTWTDAVTQVKNAYDSAGYLTKQEQEYDGKVDGSTLAAELNYATDFTSSGNYKRLNYLEYPDDTKVYRGYTHSDTAGTFQDTINDKFSRVGQIAFDDSGSIGDIVAQYDFNGMRHMVRRSHDEGSGWAGNDTRTDLWSNSSHTETSGTYAGLDRFGRTADLKMVDYSGSATDFERRKYAYDRSSNPTSIENTLYKIRSLGLTYDDLDRLTEADTGFVDDGAVVLSDLSRKYNMDLLGNLSTTAGFQQNTTSNGITHAVNATNEITTLTRNNPAGQPATLEDPFSSTLSGIWITDAGSWSTSSGKLNVDSVPMMGWAQLVIASAVGDGTIDVTVNFPDDEDSAGIIFAQKSSTTYALMVTEGSTDNVKLISYTSIGQPPTTLYTTSMSINTDTDYTFHIVHNQRRVVFSATWSGGMSIAYEYDSSSDFGEGAGGLFARDTDITFDDFIFTRLDTGQTNPAVPSWKASAKVGLDSNTLKVQTPEWGGVSKLEWAGDDDYIAQADIDLNGGSYAELIVRYADPDNYYAVRLGDEIGTTGVGDIEAVQMIRGNESTVASDTYSTASSVTLKVSIDGTTLKAWVGATEEINTSGLSDLAFGGVALAASKAKFDNVKVGYDNNADDDIDDGGDDLVLSETFSSAALTPGYDANGNLTDDGTYKYTYDAWNRLVKVTAKQDTDITLQTAKYDGLGRRLEKVVTNSGDHDATWRYYYKGHQIIQANDGSGNLLMQVYHGTCYIDEVVAMRLPHGRAYVHQDANWNVTSLTDLTGAVLERYYYSPYGESEVVAETYFGDYDGDDFVDSGDADDLCSNGGGCACEFTSSVSGDCRVFDFDCDGDLDVSDESTLEALYSGLSADMQNRRIPSTTFSPAGNVFGHQGLVLDVEIGSDQNRMRQYAPKLKRFMQRDPLALIQGAASGYQDGLNLYQYVRSNTIRRRDPTGGLAATAFLESTDSPDAYRHKAIIARSDTIPLTWTWYDYGPSSGFLTPPSPGVCPWSYTAPSHDVPDTDLEWLYARMRGVFCAGVGKDVPCRCATGSMIESCLGAICSQWNGTEFHQIWHNCWSYVNAAKECCCLTLTPLD